MGGELHYITTLRISFPEYAQRARVGRRSSSELPDEVRSRPSWRDWHAVIGERLPPITEDTMPGELANIIAGRVANVLNLRGPNFITDAACASTLRRARRRRRTCCGQARLRRRASRGGVDRNMGAVTFVKFCKIGALSATGTRPFGDGADGFVMGEGAAAFLLKRLADAERDGDKIYAVIRGVGGSSDGKGKGITAPNPIGPDARHRSGPGRTPAWIPRRPRWSKRTAPAPRSATWSRSRAWPRSSAARPRAASRSARPRATSAT